MTGARTAVTLTTIGALFYIDARFVSVLLGSGVILSATGFELLVFGMQATKTLAVMMLKDLRAASLPVLIDFYGAELLSMPVLVILNLYVGGGVFATLVGQLVTGWVAGIAVGALPFAIYRLGRSMLRSGSLSMVIPWCVVLSEVGILFLNASTAAAANGGGLAEVANFVFVLKVETAQVDPSIFAALAALYVALLLYAALGLDTVLKISRTTALSFALAASLASLAWFESFSTFPLPVVLIYLPPTVAIVAFSWWYARAR